MSNTYQVYKSRAGGLVWELPDELMNKLNLTQNQMILLRFGSLSAEVKVVGSKLMKGAALRIGFSERTLNSLKIPRGLFLSIKPLGAEEFRIGPIIGMLTYSRILAKKKFWSSVKYTRIMRRYTAYAEKLRHCGLFYLFSPGKINMQTGTITGYSYQPERKAWEAGEFAYPDVVMDRIYPNNTEIHRKLENVIGPNRIFNKKTMINKWEFFTTLKTDPVLREYLPDTQMFEYESDLNQFLVKYQGVFLKPLGGMKGKGIICVSAQGNELICRYMKGREMVTKKADKTERVWDLLGYAGSREMPYIIQEAVERMEYRQRPLGFRLMVTKNGSGDWKVRAIFAKVAPIGNFLTNRSLGADYILLKDLFPGIEKNFSCTKEELLELLNCLALRAASRLDSKFGPLGKLGLDIVLDTSGKPWLIEANGNPGSICPKVLNEFPDWAGQVYDDPIAYSVYLSGFNIV